MSSSSINYNIYILVILQKINRPFQTAAPQFLPPRQTQRQTLIILRRRNVFRLGQYRMQQELRERRQYNQHTDSKYLKKAHEQIIGCLQEVFPPDYDFSSLEKFFQQDLSITLPEISYGLVEFLVQAIKAHFIHADLYRLLQKQTQKLEASVRKHLKIEQEMKIYIEYLQSMSGKDQKAGARDRNLFEELLKQIENIKVEKEELFENVKKVKEENHTLKSEIEQKNKQIDHYSLLLQGRKKNQESTLNHSLFTSMKEEEVNSLREKDIHKALKLHSNGNGRILDFAKKNKEEKEKSTDQAEFVPYNAGHGKYYYIGKVASKNRPNSQSKLMTNSILHNNSISCKIESQFPTTKNKNHSYSNEKYERESVKYHPAQKYKLDYDSSLEKKHKSKRKKTWQTSQLIPPKTGCAYSEHSLEEESTKTKLSNTKGHQRALHFHNWQVTRESDDQSTKMSPPYYFPQNSKRNTHIGTASSHRPYPQQTQKHQNITFKV